MLDLNLEFFASQIDAGEFAKVALIEQYEAKVLTYFESTIGANNMAAAHYIVLESLNELMKNALDAGATNLFIKENSSSQASISVLDNGSGFSRDFFAADTNHLNYGDKVGGLLAIESTKKGEHKLGGQGRGLAQAYHVIKQFDGNISCSNRAGNGSGAHLEFYCTLAPASPEDIHELFNSGRQTFSSRYCQFNSQQESDNLVLSLRDGFFSFMKEKQSGLVNKKQPDVEQQVTTPLSCAH